MRFFKSTGVSFLYLAATLVLFTPFSLIDFDAHHDGYMLAQAVAINQGGLIYLDAFAQYGPVTPWFQSLFTGLFSEFPAVGLRFSNVIVLALTTFVVADFGRNMPAWWPIKRFSARLAALIWILTADFFYSVPMLPWSSALATLFGLSSIYFFGRASHQASKHFRVLYFCLGGVAAALTIFTRINVGLPLLLVAIGLAIFAILGKMKIQNAHYFVSAFLATVFMVLMVLGLSGSLKEAINQSVLWPLQWSGASTPNPGETLFQPVLNLFPTFVLPISFVLAWTVNEHLYKDKWDGSKRFSNLTLVGAAISTLAITIFEIAGKSQVPMAIRAMPYSYVEKVALIYQLLVTAGISLAVTLAILGLIKFFRNKNPNERHSAWMLIGLCGVGLATIVQITPVADSRHIWWGLPPLLLLLVNVFSTNSSSFFDFFRNPLVYSLSALLFFAPLIGSSYLIMQREQIGAISSAQGMSNFPGEAKALENVAKLISKNISDSNKVIFLVDDGYLSVADGTYRSLDENFVLWGPSQKFSKRLVGSDYVVLATADKINVDALLQSNFLLITEFEKYSLYGK